RAEEGDGLEVESGNCESLSTDTGSASDTENSVPMDLSELLPESEGADAVASDGDNVSEGNNNSNEDSDSDDNDDNDSEDSDDNDSDGMEER
ncbi:hypothetical protein Gpo141_00002370, partial [Globisporangium polare]